MQMTTSDSSRTEQRGWVYLILNDDTPGKIKIGYSTKDPVDRALELVSTGTTGTFVVIYHALVADPFAVEQEVHKRLRLADIDWEREWYSVCPDRAKEEIRAVAGVVFYEDTTARWHRSQRQPKEYALELLAEAKAATEERRRGQEEAERAARIAEEKARIEAAQEAERERRQKELEAARLRAEEAMRLAAEAEQLRIDEEKRRALAAEAEKKRQSFLAKARTLATRAACGALLLEFCYLAFGPYSPSRIADLQKRRGELSTAVLASQRKCDAITRSLSSVTLAIRERERSAGDLQATTEQLAEDERKAELNLRFQKQRQKESQNQYAPGGTPSGSRGGLSADAIKFELRVRQLAVERAETHLQGIRKEQQGVSDQIASLPHRQHTASARKAELEQSLSQEQASLARVSTSLQQATRKLENALRYNTNFPWAAKAR
jgi:hypothetical protein